MTHKHERQRLSRSYHLSRQGAEDTLVNQYRPQIEEINRKRSFHLKEIDKRHEQARRFDDQLLQRREAEREGSRALTEANIRELKQQQKLLRQGSDTETIGDFKEVSRTAEQKAGAKQNAMARAWARVKGKEKEELENKESGEGGRQR